MLSPRKYDVVEIRSAGTHSTRVVAWPLKDEVEQMLAMGRQSPKVGGVVNLQRKANPEFHDGQRVWS